ncbi:hypothetical protein HHK36_025877 [Tetracentron sinense]|uniref:Uncharacterized protein n=1 Tax=Tetracentron sinense TaxID=13715 RepID=A0A834YI86_TETSI|nr:hypothetical protein HHK36_025877 [Tetracentron sinense]
MLNVYKTITIIRTLLSISQDLLTHLEILLTIGFDDHQTIFTKVSYAKEMGLLGYYVWHVGSDNNWPLSQEGCFRGMGSITSRVQSKGCGNSLVILKKNIDS